MSTGRAQQNVGAWKGYREKHGPGAEPTVMEFSPSEHGDLKIGNDGLSVVELVADFRRVESELIEIEAST